MLNVTQAFQDVMLQPGRRIVPRVIVDYTDPFIDQSIEVSTTESNRSEAYTQACDGKDIPSAKFASFEPGAWKLGQGFCLAPANKETQIGWRGRQLSDELGEYSVPFPALTVMFTSRPVDKFRVVGDSKRGEWPVDFKVEAFRGEVLAKAETVTGNTQPIWELEFDAVTEITKMVITVHKWSEPERFVKIVEFFSSVQEVYEGDDVISISLIEEREAASGSLPIGNISANELEIKLNNYTRKFDAGNVESPIYQLIKPNRRIKAELGLELLDESIEYVPIFSGWTQDWQAPEDSLWASTSARDRLEVLQSTVFDVSEVYQNTTLYDLAETVLQHAGAGDYFIDEELKEFALPYAWFGPISHREALRLIVAACLGQAYCNRTGQIRVEGSSYLAAERTISQLTITGDHFFKKDCPAVWSEVCNVVEVTVAPLRPDAMEVVYEDTEQRASGGVVTITYSEVPVIDAAATVEGDAVINSAAYYAWGAVLDITGTNFAVIIEGRVLRPAGAITTTAEDKASIRDNGRLVYKVEENPLIQTAAVGQRIADELLAMFAEPRRDLTLDWIGHLALELGDRITAPDYADISTRDYHVISLELDYAGGLTGRLKGRLAL